MTRTKSKPKTVTRSRPMAKRKSSKRPVSVGAASRALAKARAGTKNGVPHAAFLDPGRDAVFGFKVGLGGSGDGLWRVESLFLPSHASVNHPSQDAGQLGLSLPSLDRCCKVRY